MRILENTISPIPECIEFSKTLSGGNYTVEIRAFSFLYDQQANTFDIDNLRSIFPDDADDIQGKIIETTWTQCLDNISKALEYSEYHEVFINAKKIGKDLVSDALHKERNAFFWKTLGKHISLPPDKIYEHLPAQFSLFADFMMWGFCYILLSGNKGVIVYGLSYD